MYGIEIVLVIPVCLFLELLLVVGLPLKSVDTCITPGVFDTVILADSSTSTTLPLTQTPSPNYKQK